MKIHNIALCVCVMVLAAAATSNADEPLPLKNPGFEEGLDGWLTKGGDFDMSHAVPDAAHTGKLGLRVTDADDKHGSSLMSEQFDVEQGRTFELRFWVRNISGHGLAVYLQFLDKTGYKLTDVVDTLTNAHSNQIKVIIPEDATEWKQFTVRGVAPPTSTKMYIWIHSGNAAVCVTDLDDFELVRVN